VKVRANPSPQRRCELQTVPRRCRQYPTIVAVLFWNWSHGEHRRQYQCQGLGWPGIGCWLAWRQPQPQQDSPDKKDQSQNDALPLPKPEP